MLLCVLYMCVELVPTYEMQFVNKHIIQVSRTSVIAKIILAYAMLKIDRLSVNDLDRNTLRSQRVEVP